MLLTTWCGNRMTEAILNNKIWAGTFGRGLWSTGLTIGIGENELAHKVPVFPNQTVGKIFISNLQASQSQDVEIMHAIGAGICENAATRGYRD